LLEARTLEENLKIQEFGKMRVTDPVCSMTIESNEAEAKEIWQGQTYYFCGHSCHEKFKAAPERYANKRDSGKGPNRPGINP
jgi:Cu+-exporting ATPase